MTICSSQASASPHFFCLSHPPLDDELEPVSAALDELLGLVVREVEDVDAVDLDQVVVRPAAGLASHAVQGNLGRSICCFSRCR